MAESTIRKTKVSFTIKATGTFMVECEGGESPRDVLRGLIERKILSLPDLYLHSDEFDWELSVDLDDESSRRVRLRQHLEWAHGLRPIEWEDSGMPHLVSAHEEAHGDIGDLSVGPIDEEFYPPELGGGRMPKESPTLICGCGRLFSDPCVCGRDSSQFERHDEMPGPFNF